MSQINHQIISSAAALTVACETAKGALREAQETEAACGSYPTKLLSLTFKRRGGGCYDNTPADGREDEGSGRETYITIIIFWGECDEEGTLQMSVDAHRLAARCVKSIPLHLTARPSHSLCDIEREGAIFV